MSAPRTVKAASRPFSVGVIFSAEDLQRALRLRKPPDFFELRLDGLISIIDQLPAAIRRLRRPLIITARSTREGGANHLPLSRRRDLLLRFLPAAALVDLELSDAGRFSSVRKLARARNVDVILSLHELRQMPKRESLRAAATRAHSLGATVFKIAARTDEQEQVQTLVEFMNSRSPIAISAMGVGRLGRDSRAALAHAGSVLNYAYVARPTIPGQLSLSELRAALPGRR